MKRRMMAFLMAGALLLTAGIATMAVYATSDGSDDRPTVVQERSEPVRHLPAERSGGIGFTEGDTVLPEPATEIDSDGGNAQVDDSGSASDDEVNDGSTPGLGAGSGGVIKNNDPVEAGGLNGGVVLRDDPVQAGGRGGLCPDNPFCIHQTSQVQAGGLRGGVVLYADPSLAQ